jgi:hypothetical protein
MVCYVVIKNKRGIKMNRNDDIRGRVIESIRIWYKKYWLTHAKISTGEAMKLDNALSLSLIQEKVDILTHCLNEKDRLEILKKIRGELRTTSGLDLGLSSEEKHRLDNLLSQFSY